MVVDDYDKFPGGHELATTWELADYLRTNVGRLAKMRHTGEGPRFIKDGRRVLYRWSDVEAWLEASTRLKASDDE